MKSDEKRSHRLNYLLKFYLQVKDRRQLYARAKQMGVSDSTANDYVKTVLIQAASRKEEMTIKSMVGGEMK